MLLSGGVRKLIQNLTPVYCGENVSKNEKQKAIIQPNTHMHTSHTHARTTRTHAHAYAHMRTHKRVHCMYAGTHAGTQGRMHAYWIS